jgi:sugar lactone lactonase YvrE
VRLRIAILAPLALAASASADPQLADPRVGSLELVTAPSAPLDLVDGLAFDAAGHLFAALEISGAGGGVVAVDAGSGAVTPLVTGISRADQIALHPSGDFFVTSEISPGATSQRIYRVMVSYGAGGAPVAATAASLTTSQAVNNPEGLAVIPSAGDFGSAGDLYVCEDRNPGRVLRVEPGSGAATLLVGALARPEGLAFGGLPAALYVAETSNHRVLRIDAAGATSVLGDPSAVALASPDNVELGPDGFLYVSEDRPAPNSRLIRIAPDGSHGVFATGFGQAAGLAFHPETGDLYVSEQDFDRIWRVRFRGPRVPGLAAPGLVVLAALALASGAALARRA